VITCPSCSKQNQDHYRFCLGCGAELPRGQAAPAAPEEDAAEIVDEETQIGTGAVSSAPEEDDAPEDAGLPPGMCPECEFVNPTTNRFCASCGFRLDEVPAAPKKPKPPPAADERSGAILVALDPEGNEVGRHELASGEAFVGRDTGGVFASDTFLSPLHAVFTASGGKVTVRDNESLNGVFRRALAEQPIELQSGQRFRVGQELLVFDALDPQGKDDDGVEAMGSSIEDWIGRVSLIVDRGDGPPSVAVPLHGINIGRERGNVLFPEDGYVSGLHCHISHDDGRTFVTDLGSSNGTLVQLLGEVDLNNGDVLLMGQQLFRVTI